MDCCFGFYLVKLQGHPDGRGDNFMQKVHVGKYPLVSCCYSKVTFEEGVKAIQERVQAEGHVVSCRSQSSPPQDAQGKGQGH